MPSVIDLAQAQRLSVLLTAQNRPWQPAPGDRFMVPGRDFDQVFVIADMTIEVQELRGGRLLRFNGTTEWALDSIDASEVVWLPWEHQLRELLGASFASLESLPQPARGYAVSLVDGTRHVDTDAEQAYLRALLATKDQA
jgi:hypothetical protein